MLRVPSGIIFFQKNLTGRPLRTHMVSNPKRVKNWSIDMIINNVLLSVLRHLWLRNCLRISTSLSILEQMVRTVNLLTQNVLLASWTPSLHKEIDWCAVCDSYYPRQFTSSLHSIVVILVRLVTAWFVQRDGKASIRRSKNILHRAGCFVGTRDNCSYCAYEGVMLF
jgi:hypothetical protein